MVDIPLEELAVIFEPQYKDGEIVLVPLDVVVGCYNEYDAKFIDDELYTYSHVTNCELGRSYAFRLRISELLNNFSDKSLEEIRNIIFKSFSNFTYTKTFIDDEEVIQITDLENGTSELLLDEDTKEKLMCIFGDEELEQEILKRSEEYTENNQDIQGNNQESKKEKQDNNKININPHELFREITKTVKGQEEAIWRILTTIWENHTKKDQIAKNMLVFGLTGVGKTEIFRQIAKKINVPLLIISVTGMSQAGYVGGSTEDILANLLVLTKGDVEKAEHAIVILDEFDKCAFSDKDDGKISTDGIQNELLKIVEDGTFSVDYRENGAITKKIINTSHITFVGVGAPSKILKVRKQKQLGFGNEIYEKEVSKNTITPSDLKQLGIKSELIGRMGKIIVMNEMSLELCKDIVKTSDKSLYVSDLKFIKSYIPNVMITNEDEVVEEIAKKSLALEVGARGISTIVDSMFEGIMRDISNPDEQYSELEFDKEIVNNPKKYILRK